jgi:hypothetical protein
VTTDEHIIRLRGTLDAITNPELWRNAVASLDALDEEVERLRAEVLAEREACAQLVEAAAEEARLNGQAYREAGNLDVGGSIVRAAVVLELQAAAIRARGKK